MNREEAAVYVWETYEWCMREYENARADKGMMSKTKEAFDLAIAALRSGWVRTSERLPTATDEVGGMVVTATRVPCFDGLGEIIEIRQAYAVIRGGETRYNYWMALPKLPNMEDEA